MAGRCPISLEVMRRPVVTSTGQVYDEISLVRYTKAGNKRCPTSGADLESVDGRVVRTPVCTLREVIRHAAIQAEVGLPACLTSLGSSTC